jgi:glucokinase
VSQRLIGVDVGGTKVSVAVLEGTTLSEPEIRPTVLSSAEALVEQLAHVVGDHGHADAVGIGVPASIDFATGTARYGPNIPLVNVPLRGLLTDRLRMPVFVDNDANAAALCEAYDDDLRPIAQNLVLLTLGTGVGGGVVIGGRIYRGASGAAAELGHTIVGASLDAGAPAAGDFPQEGSLESLASGRALDSLGKERGLGRGPQVVEAARGGDASALEALNILGERLGIGIANAINTFDPEEVVIGGGVSSAADLFLERAEQVARSFAMPGVGTKTRIRLARWGPKAGVRGAALLAGQELG